MARSRRRFLRDSAVVTAAAALGACTREAPPPSSSSVTAPVPGAPPRIAIVGGGMAGLNTAWELRKAGLEATIFEGADRTGGRMFTANNRLGDRLTAELGAESSDSTHEQVLGRV